MKDLTPPPRPASIPESWDPVWCEETELWGWAPGRRRRATKDLIAPAQPDTLARLAEQYGVSVPSGFFGNERSEARRRGDRLYWGNDGCHRHGFPMLRHTKSGTCVLCDRLKNEEKKAERAAGKYARRRYLDDIPKSKALALQYNRPTFWTGLPCKPKGHVAERRTKGGACVQCACEREGRAYLPPIPGKRPSSSVRPELRYVPPPTTNDVPRPKPEAPAVPPVQVSKPAYTKQPMSADEAEAFLTQLTGIPLGKP